MKQSKEQMERDRSIGTIAAVITLMGSVAAAGRALGVNSSSIYRWKTGEVVLGGSSLVAARALLRHPEDFQAAKNAAFVCVRPRRRRLDDV